MKAETRSELRSVAKADEGHRTLRPVDGFVVGGEASWDSGQNLWLLLSKPGERLIDFFLEDEEDMGSADPVPCACAGVLPDGTVLIGEVDWEMDRFLSEMLDEQDQARKR